MVRQSGFPAAVGSLPAWNILFAREPEPEPDLDLDEMDDQNKTADAGSSPDDPKKPSGQRPLLWGLLIVVAAAGGYLAMNPDLLMDMLGPGTETASVPAPPSAKRATVPPALPTSPSPGVPAMPKSPAAPPAQAAPRTATPLPPSTAAATPPVQAEKPGPAPASAAPAASTPSPLFSEGQAVTVAPDPALPAAAVSLSGNAARTKPGPMVSPTAVLTVVDGELRDRVWVYAVRTPQGTTGWVEEKRLRAVVR